MTRPVLTAAEIAQLDVDEALATDAAERAPVDLEQVAADALRAQIAATLATWSRRDLAPVARALALGSPSQLARRGAGAPLVYEGKEAGEPQGVRVLRPQGDEVREALGHLYGLLGEDRREAIERDRRRREGEPR